VPEGLEVVVGLVEAPVIGDQIVVAIAGIRQNVVVVDVHAGHVDGLPGLAAILAPVHVRLRRPDGLRVVAVHDDFVVVAGISAAVAVVDRAASASPTARRRFVF
jgi:hypothetical protein